MSCNASKDSLLAVTMEPARQASRIFGSAAYCGIKVLFQLLTDYSVRHPNKSLFQRKKSDIIERQMLPGAPRQNCNYRHCLLHSWHLIYNHNKKQDIKRTSILCRSVGNECNKNSCEIAPVPVDQETLHLIKTPTFLQNNISWSQACTFSTAGVTLEISPTASACKAWFIPAVPDKPVASIWQAFCPQTANLTFAKNTADTASQSNTRTSDGDKSFQQINSSNADIVLGLRSWVKLSQRYQDENVGLFLFLQQWGLGASWFSTASLVVLPRPPQSDEPPHMVCP